MKSSFIVSIHAIEKHLDARNVHASVFFRQHMMYESIKNCLNRPDVVKQYGKRFELIKRFTYDIGLMGYTDQICQSRVYQDQKDNFRYNRLPYSVMKQVKMDMFRLVCL